MQQSVLKACREPNADVPTHSASRSGIRQKTPAMHGELSGLLSARETREGGREGGVSGPFPWKLALGAKAAGASKADVNMWSPW